MYYSLQVYNRLQWRNKAPAESQSAGNLLVNIFKARIISPQKEHSI